MLTGEPVLASGFPHYMAKEGRPTKYTKEAFDQAKKYIDACEDTEEQVISGQSDKFTTYRTKVTVDLPTIEGLALHLKVHKDTIYEWEDVHPEFSDLLHVLRGKQFKVLVNKSLSGDYNCMITKLLLTKHGYADKQDLGLSVIKGQSFKIDGQTIEF